MESKIAQQSLEKGCNATLCYFQACGTQRLATERQPLTHNAAITNWIGWSREALN